MDLQAEKLKLVEAILEIEDISLIKNLQNFVADYDHDWFDDLSEEQQQAVIKSLEKLDRGEGIPHEEVMARLGL